MDSLREFVIDTDPLRDLFSQPKGLPSSVFEIAPFVSRSLTHQKKKRKHWFAVLLYFGNKLDFWPEFLLPQHI